MSNMEGLTPEQMAAHMKVESLIRQATSDQLIRNAVWAELKTLDSSMQIKDGVAEALRRVKAATAKAADRLSGEHAATAEDDTDHPHVERDPRQRRPAVRVRHDADGSPAEESPEELSQIIAKMAEARGGRPLIHRWNVK
jgi:hypothetical protein